jgi:Helicase associated domain
LTKLYEMGFCWSAKPVRKMPPLTANSIPAARKATTMATTDGTTPHVSTTPNHTHTADTVVALGGEGGRHLPTLHQPQEQQHQHLLPSSDHLPTYDIPAPSTTQPGSHFMGMYHHHLPVNFPTAAVTTTTPAPAAAILGPVATTPTDTSIIHASLTIGPAIVAAAAAAAAAAGALSGGGGGGVTALPAMAEDDAIWEDFYHRLVQFREWHGHTLVPRKYEADPKLSTWVEQQRAAWNRDYNNTKTTATSTQPVPMMMNEGSANQNQNQNHYSTTASLGVGEEEGAHHSDHQQDEEDDAIWNAVADMDNMTAATTTAATTTTGLLLSPTGGGLVPYKKLSLERKQKLDAVGFVWSLRSKRIGDHWDEMFRQLVDYKNRHGDCLVPSRYEANMKLGKVCCVVLQEK